VNLQISYWYDSQTFAPDKINSALLRLSKNALLKGGIELPDPAREVVFPKGVPVIQTERTPAPPKKQREESAPEEETSVATASEGHLSNEEAEVSETSKGSVPEADENLLKD
jgi:hypothetical protein